MKRNTRSNLVFQRMILGSIAVLLLISADGLALFAQQKLGQDNAATVLLALYLASWLYVLSIVGLVLLLVWWLRVWVKQAARSRYSPAEPSSRHLEKPEMEGPQFLQQEVAPAVPSRSSWESDDRNKITSPSRVA